MLRRLGEIWPDLAASLQEENGVLASTLDEVGGRLRAAGVEWEPSGEPPADPVRRYRWLLSCLEGAVTVLHDTTASRGLGRRCGSCGAASPRRPRSRAGSSTAPSPCGDRPRTEN